MLSSELNCLLSKSSKPYSMSHIYKSKTGLLGHLTTSGNVLGYRVEKQQILAQGIQTPPGQAQLLGKPLEKDPGVT